MAERIKQLWFKYEEIITYLIVGGITTVISNGAMFLWNFAFFENTLYPTPAQNIVLSAVNWVTGVISAYFMNRRYVFKSHAPMLEEAIKFVVSRISTFVLDLVIRQAFGLLGVDVVITSVFSAVLVVIGNYVFSKLFVFKKKK